MANVTVDFTTNTVATDPLGVGFTCTEFGGSPVPLVGDSTWFNALNNLGVGHVRASVAYYSGSPGYGASGSSRTTGTATALVSAIKSMGAIPLISYNGDTSDNGINSTDAGNLVTYADAHSWGVKYWSIGNEPDNGGGSGAYESIVNGIANAMYAADNTINIGAPAAAYWDTSLISNIAANVTHLGSLTYHAYDGANTDGTGFPTDGQLYTHIKTDLPAYRTGVLYGLEEMNWHFEYNDSGSTGNTTTSFYDWHNTCFIADNCGQVLSAGGHATQYGDFNTALGLMNDGTGVNSQPGSKYTPLPAYWGLGIVTGMNGQFKKYGAHSVSCSNSLGISALGTYAWDNNKILVVNKSGTSSQSLVINMTLAGGATSGTYNVWSTNQGSPTSAITEVVTGASFSSSTITYTVPAGTAVSIDITPATPSGGGGGGGTGTTGATYGYSEYGFSTYGPAVPTGNYPGSLTTIPVVNTAYIFPDMAASVQDYGKILVTWGSLPTATMATVTEFRLLTNPWGFPVDQNDGTIVLDITGSPPAPGIQYLDVNATPGEVQYYGIYILSGGVWLRGGFTACLLPYYYGYDIRLMSDLPAYYQNQDLGVFTADIPVPAPALPVSGQSLTNPYAFDVDVWLSNTANVLVNGVPLGQQTFFTLPAGGTVTISYGLGTTWSWVTIAQQPENTALTNFLQILGMGLDIIKSQYVFKFKGLNNPMGMSLGDLANFCAEIGLPYNPEIPAYTMRKAALYWGRVMQERGTLPGISEHITLLTGYQADIQTSRNIMLDDDQSVPVDPVYPSWQANTKYKVGELVTFPVAQPWSVVSTYPVGAVVSYNDLLYTCTIANTTLVPPTTTSNWSQNVNGPYLYYCLVANQGNQPTGSLSSNTWWSAAYGGDVNGSEGSVALVIPDIGNNAGTWEFLAANNTHYSESVNIGFPTPQTWVQGASSPTTGPNGFAKTIKSLNNSGSTITNAWLRSISRNNAAVSVLNPDPQLVVEHAVPVPSGIDPWSQSITYQTGEIVSYLGINYIALRQSRGATPPGQQVVLNQNYDFETGLTPWVGDGHATVTQSSAFAYHGTHSMSISYTGSLTNVLATSENIPVIPGGTYVSTALVYSSSASGPTVVLNSNFNDSFGVYIGGNYPGSVSLAASTWTALSSVFTVPDNAFQIDMSANMEGTMTGGFTTYWDLVELTCIATPEWAPLGADQRLPVTMSGYGISDLGFAPTTSDTVVPFCEWYDNWGNIISRVFARTSSSLGGYPANYQYDGFDTGAGYPLAGRVPAISNVVWSVPLGDWTVSTAGAVYATNDADSLAVVPSPAAGTSAATVISAAATGDDCGPLWWYNNTSNFWVAGLLQLYYVSGGTTRVVAYSGTAPSTGDRIYAEFNNAATTTTIPTGTLTGPSVFVYKNSRSSANTLVVVGSGGSAPQTAMSSLTSPYLPSTSATASNAGIASIAV